MKPTRETCSYLKLISFIPIAALLIFLTSCVQKSGSVREKLDFNKEWKFMLADEKVFTDSGYDDSSWRILKLPHDWSIEGEFKEDNPAGVGGGALPGGTAWYRKTFYLPASDSLKKIYITFDGIYHNSSVYLNGQLLGERSNGYIGFQYDMTPYLFFGDEANVLAVRVDNSDQPNSRWYSGSGIYRNVWLEKMEPLHIDHWGTHILAKLEPDLTARVNLTLNIKNSSSEEKKADVITTILDDHGTLVDSQSKELTIGSGENKEIEQAFTISDAKPWSIDKPQLYKAVTTISLDNKDIDTYVTPFGIRDFRFDPERGFFLNGVPTKILGVCNHHDLGALGAAVNTRAIERQLEILKEMGCNAIRTSHNPPAPELLDLCDRMGFLVMDETFDMWAKKKSEFDYSKDWDKWHERDLRDHLLRDRNHPCVFSWSIGNEILEQWDSAGMTIARELSGIVKEMAPDFFITSALNDPVPGNFIFKSGGLDLVGFNYHHELFESFPENFPGQCFIGTETNSGLATRGSYDMPGDSIRIWPKRWDLPFNEGNPDNTCSSYDNCRAPWGSTQEATWKIVRKHDFLSGVFVWTGFDYLGEPTPYSWPSRSSFFGLIDLSGFPKDAYYYYQSEWTDKPVLHLFPHWNWVEGQSLDVWAYANFDEVELFVNGESQGSRSRSDEQRHVWWRVKYAPGSIKAVARNANGETKEVSITTAGEQAKIELLADRDTISADGKDLSFITVNIVDKDGVLVPHADVMVHFDVPPEVEIAGVDNGNQNSHEAFKADHRKAFNGKCLLIIRSKEIKGLYTIQANAEGLETANLTLTLD